MRDRPLVLVVDDDERVRELAREILASREIEVVTATNGSEGVEVARERRPDLIILDVMMPGLDGYKACALLKEDPHLKGTPIVMFTASDGVKFNEQAFRAGAALCLSKPFEARRFLTIVELALSQAGVFPHRAEAERRQRAFRRHFARYPVRARATGGTAGKREAAGFTGNVSAGGVFCTLPERFPVMTPLLVQVETAAGPLAFSATVAWCGSSSARRPGDVPHGLRILQARTPEDAASWTQVLQTLAEASGAEAEGEA